jgi:hypothetical protein
MDFVAHFGPVALYNLRFAEGEADRVWSKYSTELQR